MAERIKTSVSVDPTIWKQVKLKAVDKDKELGDALEEALIGWLNGNRPSAETPTSPSIPLSDKSRARSHRLLDRIYDSGSHKTIDAIVSNLETFAASAEFLAGHPELFLGTEEDNVKSEENHREKIKSATKKKNA
jgi:hypothetical protein